jgi:hypothetical protein
MMTKDIEAAIREHFPMPQEIRTHASSANHDLYFGPLGVDHWRIENDDDTLPDYDYCQSRQVLADWLDDLGGGYISEDCLSFSETEPQGEWFNEERDEYSDQWQDEAEGWVWFEPEPYYEITPADIAEAFGYAELYRH